MKVEINNLTALIQGRDLNLYQRSLAVEEWHKLLNHVDEMEQALSLGGVSQRTFTSTCTEVEDMAVEIDQFINQHALAKPMTYSRKLRQYLANKLNEYVG